jgi:NADH-quinone oxidoreductase subunit M
VFTAQDGFLYYIFWELALIPIYFICLLWGEENRRRATFKFFIYTLAGSLFMLVAFIYVKLHTPNSSFMIDELYLAGRGLTLPEQTWVFVALFVAFAIKMPVFPFHTWQPDTYTTAPTAGTMLLGGIMLKMGTYSVIRWLIPMVPNAWDAWAHVCIVLSVASVILGSFYAMTQRDYKRLIAYSSVAHVGMIAAGLLTFSVEGLQGGLFQMLAHGLYVVGLFFVIEVMMRRVGTRIMSSLGGIRRVEPLFALLFLMILLGSVALPLTAGFVGEFLLITGLVKYNAWLAGVAGLTVILGAVYMLRSYQTIMLGEPNEHTKAFAPLTSTEKLVLIPIAVLIFVLGVFPQFFLDISADDVQRLTNDVQSAIAAFKN